MSKAGETTQDEIKTGNEKCASRFRSLTYPPNKSKKRQHYNDENADYLKESGYGCKERDKPKKSWVLMRVLHGKPMEHTVKVEEKRLRSVLNTGTAC